MQIYEPKVCPVIVEGYVAMHARACLCKPAFLVVGGRPVAALWYCLDCTDNV